MTESCVFCKREVPTRGHHVVPRCKGGTDIVPTCHSCEDFIHKTWSHNELRDTFNTVASILADARFQKFLKWLNSKKPQFFEVNAVEREDLVNTDSATLWRKLQLISPGQQLFSKSGNSKFVCGLVCYFGPRLTEGKCNKCALCQGTASAAKCN